MGEFDDYNAEVIGEFRANGGVVGGAFEGVPLLLLHTTGARTGAARVNPLIPRIAGDRVHVFAAAGGSERNPDWYYNLKAHPEVGVEMGGQAYQARAEEVGGAERDALYASMATAFENFAEYAETAGRVIPVIELIRL